MKRFKKVLALVLAGVLALAMLTACDGTTDSDKIMPDDGTVEVVMTINNTAANKGLGQVEYSAKYSAVTKALLENWLEWRNDGSNTKYRENYDKITAELGNVKIVVGLTKDTTPLAFAEFCDGERRKRLCPFCIWQSVTAAFLLRQHFCQRLRVLRERLVGFD